MSRRTLTFRLICSAALAACLIGSYATSQKPLGQWPFQAEIDAFDRLDAQHPPQLGGIVFTGSSSIRIWKTVAEDYPGLNVINRGFGGSAISDSVHFAFKTTIRYAPRQVIFYAGTNDIAAGKSAKTVFNDYKAYVEEVHRSLPQTKIDFISISPAPSRWLKWNIMTQANLLIRTYSQRTPNCGYIDIVPLMLDAKGEPRPELFQADMLHMNAEGYKVWIEAVRPHLQQNGGRS